MLIFLALTKIELKFKILREKTLCFYIDNFPLCLGHKSSIGFAQDFICGEEGERMWKKKEVPKYLSQVNDLSSIRRLIPFAEFRVQSNKTSFTEANFTNLMDNFT
jgi:hypothetical protein